MSNVFIIGFGLIDVFYILWVIFTDIIKQKIPFYDTLIESLNVGASFSNGSILSSLLSLLGFFLIISICFSGPLLLFKKKIGIYISFIQFPFRVIAFIPPTFFFLHSPLFNVFHSLILSFSILLIIETLKLYIEILWIKEQKTNNELKKLKESEAKGVCG